MGRLCAAILFLTVLPACESGTEASPVVSEAAVANPPPLVRSAIAEPVGGTLTHREVGIVRPSRTIGLAVEVAGRVLAVPYEVGERVAPSATAVIEIDPESYRLAVSRAEAAFDAARARAALAGRERNRVAALMEERTSLVSEADLDRAENALAVAAADARAAEAALGEARLALARTRTEAPAGYRVAARTLEPGDYAAPGVPAIELIDDRTLRIAFDVPGERLPVLPIGAEVPFEVKEIPGERFEGRVGLIGPRADERSRRFPVELHVDRPDPRLRPGMVAVVVTAVPRPGAAGVATVPRAALGRHLDEVYVFVLAAGRATRRPVRVVEFADLDPALVALAGVDPGEHVAIEGIARLTDDQAVRTGGDRD